MSPPEPSSPLGWVRKTIRVPSADQSGWSPAASLHGVIRRRPLPSTLTTNSARPSCGSERLALWRSKTNRLPSGDHCGALKSAANGRDLTTLRTWRPSASITAIEVVWIWLFTTGSLRSCPQARLRARRRPSGDQAGPASSAHRNVSAPGRQDGGLRRLTPVPSERIVKTWQAPPLVGQRSKAIREPSGDQAGWSSTVRVGGGGGLG